LTFTRSTTRKRHATRNTRKRCVVVVLQTHTHTHTHTHAHTHHDAHTPCTLTTAQKVTHERGRDTHTPRERERGETAADTPARDTENPGSSLSLAEQQQSAACFRRVCVCVLCVLCCPACVVGVLRWPTTTRTRCGKLPHMRVSNVPACCCCSSCLLRLYCCLLPGTALAGSFLRPSPCRPPSPSRHLAALASDLPFAAPSLLLCFALPTSSPNNQRHTP
jgi:hypothetical protein